VLVIGAVALTAGLGLTGCLPPPENGRLPETSLTTVTPDCRAASDVAPRLFRLLYNALLMQVPLWPETQSYAIVDPPRPSSCYRDYDMQVWWRDYYCFFGACHLAAVPGTSIHGWGRAVDFECGGQRMTFESPCYAFLKYFGASFGFFHPAWAEPGQPGAEPWHWESY
jgi:hypothetical protein